MKLTPAMEQFVLHWGEMGTRWGVNRSVAQIHALLFLAEAPLNAEEIAETLTIARSNVSTSLKELMSWNLVQLVHLKGDRRDHFEAEHDCWVMLRRIAEGRKEREIDPTLSTLRKCALDADGDGETPAAARERLADLLAFMEQLDRWYRDMSALDAATLRRLIRMGGAVVKLIPGKSVSARKSARNDE